MELHSRVKTNEKNLKRLGRGHGSGRGKTSGRGTKGQKARGKIKAFFEGGALPLSKRIPFLRGRGRNKIIKLKPIAIKVEKLNNLPPKSTVDLDFLVKSNIIEEEEKKAGVKIIGGGELKVSLTVKIPASKGARISIEKAGGTIAE